ncbi:hypothetical protein Plo01_52440 [Planobispora longispora]|uniref:Uncharacterized protein n=1 Tax=Planobispora longispora TaxID=28887 RepID=A0A8J3W7H0_9ACTN|nr:hypothetical protein GCM10020093_048560 [Planobispora longispora]GIH78815.1 hypothetical protein Plo01_52440 [Planobispora longispora]
MLPAGHTGPSLVHQLGELVHYVPTGPLPLTQCDTDVALRLQRMMDHLWLIRNLGIEPSAKDRLPPDCFFQPTWEKAHPDLPIRDVDP